MIFSELIEIRDLTKYKLNPGDRFLTGNSILSQKDSKKVGDLITYYLVTDVNDETGVVNYRPVYEKLEE